MAGMPNKNPLVKRAGPSERAVLLALGANLGKPAATIGSAIQAISSSIGPVLAASRMYRTRPLNPPELKDTSQPDFINAVVRCACGAPAAEILRRAKDIELSFGRDRSREMKWGPRLIDIDILAVGNEISSSPQLTLPHPEMHRRDFVLYPLRDVAPQFTHPLLQLSVDQLIYNYHARGEPGLIVEVAGETSDSLPLAAGGG